MIYDVSTDFEELINNFISKRLGVLPLSYPCKVSKVDDSGVLVEVETLLKKEDADVPRLIPLLQSPYLTLPVKEGDLGIALNCSFLFSPIVNDEEIQKNERAVKENGLFFIPLVSKGGFKGEVGKTTLSDQGFKSSLTLEEEQVTLKASDMTSLEMGNEVTLQTGGTLEFKGATASLGEILGDLIQILNSLSATQSTAPGSPVVLPPTFLSDLVNLQSKIKGNLK